MGIENHERSSPAVSGQDDLLGELDSIKTLLDPARTSGDRPLTAPPADDGIPVLNDVVTEPGEPPLLTSVADAGGEPPPGEEELEALAETIVERQLAALRDDLKRTVLAELKTRLNGRSS